MTTTIYLVKSEDAGLRTISGNVGAVFVLLGYGAAGLFSVALAQVVRYLASIAEATGKHALGRVPEEPHDSPDAPKGNALCFSSRGEARIRSRPPSHLVWG